MSKFKDYRDVLEYPYVQFNHKPYHASFALNWDYDPRKPYATLTFYPRFDEKNKEMGAEPHWHMPLNIAQVKRLHKWLGQFIKDKGQ